MQSFWTVIILGLSVLDSPFNSFIVSAADAPNATAGVPSGNPVNQLWKYRKVHWCITGYDEPLLHRWPLNQFVPILQRSTLRYRQSDSHRYKIVFHEIKTNQTDLGRDGVLLKTVHVIVSAEEKRDIKVNVLEEWTPLMLEGLIVQANYNPEGIAMPGGEFFELDDRITCSDCNDTVGAQTIPCRKRSYLHMVHPTVAVFHHEMRPKSVAQKGQIIGLKSEIHINFRWYSPPCADTSRLLFNLLPVMSFSRNEWDVVKLGPYEVASRGPEKHSQIHPSPYLPYAVGTVGDEEVLCHARSSPDILTESHEKFIDFEMSSKFDCCIRNEDNPKNPALASFVPPEDLYPTYSCRAAADKKAESKFVVAFGSESWICNYPAPIKCRFSVPPEKQNKFYRNCQPCPTVPPTTIITTTQRPRGFVKRTPHGWMMIMTNFCLQPIVIYIARFYKETYNAIRCKGTKTWYWMHLLGGMVSSTMVYFGYFSGGSDSDPRIKPHVILGNVYIMILAFCYMTAWGRNKNSLINIVMEFLHGCLGYTVISMAVVSIITTPTLGFESKLCIYLMVGFQILFMMAMTHHICRLDKEFGMKPRRRHFPTVEARFDEIKVPEGKFRKTMLTVFSLTTFTLSVTSTFFQ